jgi:hypothetical protein
VNPELLTSFCLRQFETTYWFEKSLALFSITTNLHFLVIAVVRQGAEEHFTSTDEGVEVSGRNVLEQSVQCGT